MPAKKTEVKQRRAGKQLQIETAVNVKKTSCVARKRLDPATISKPSELERARVWHGWPSIHALLSERRLEGKCRISK
jgi:hypothetical protein